MTVRAPHLHDALRAFCLAAFAELAPEAAEAEVPFVVEEHASGLFEYRPLLRDHVEARAYWLADLPDARIALTELSGDPAAGIFARGRDERALFQSILLPLLVRTAEACGGFDWDDDGFERVYADLERTLYGSTRLYAAIAPLVGLSVGATVELAPGFSVRQATAEELGHELAPPRFGSEPERGCVIQLERELPGDQQEPPDAPGELAAVVTALRLATGAALAGGPVVLDRLDWHPLAIRPMPGIAATEPAGEPERLDPWRGRLAGELLERLTAAADDSELIEAVERWELALFEDEPLRSERLRESLAALLGGADGLWAAAMRATLLVGDGNRERSGLIDRCAHSRAASGPACRSPTTFAARSSRRFCTTTGLASSPRWTSHCSVCARVRPAISRRVQRPKPPANAGRSEQDSASLSRREPGIHAGNSEHRAPEESGVL